MIHRYGIVGSTMDIARQLAASGAPHGSTVVAAEQTAGQGRLGRTWHSPPGAGLYFTTVLRYPELKPVVTLALGVAVADALREAAGVAPDLRWPNDVLLDGRKVAGILTQYDHGAVLAGVGVNVNHAGFPEELRDIATSLRMAAGREFPLEDLLDRLVRGVSAADPASAIEDFSSRSSYVEGREVTVDLPEGTLSGVTCGLDEAGFLLVRRPGGNITTIFAGGVRPASRTY